MEDLKTKEGSQRTLFEKFKLKKTSDFQLALQQGNIDLVEEAVNYIVDKRNEDEANFPQYAGTFASWLKDRRDEIALYRSLKEKGDLEKLEPRSVESQRAELQSEFGFNDTAGFRAALKTNITEAERFIDYIVENKYRFPIYLAILDRWLTDRQRELTEAKK